VIGRRVGNVTRDLMTSLGVSLVECFGLCFARLVIT